VHVNRTAIDKDISKRSVVDNDRVRGKFKNHENFPTSTVDGTTDMLAFLTAITKGEALASWLPVPFRRSGSLYGTRHPTTVRETM
jgi:hypothetical protein